ncbi:hypothetical protein CYMTET_51505 [Cymbomonas tetramitiformis]|uniref:DNA2/NAM7 helicase-like C-terminal domain-containing protein n=1 Tax=Cymbomonas tetramitiformis TaxID=36881 RepID=A0AAE0BMD8_9CHLO|nr:hypothetical protein CYMTET_51505 [Cymbomonas tetramitiformis]
MAVPGKLQAGAVVVDEAGQAGEAETLLAVRAARPGCCLLVGDPAQLPATVLSRTAGPQGLGRSLLERVAAGRGGCAMLQRQYRMHPEISRVPNRLFYEGRLQDAEACWGRSEESVQWMPNVDGALRAMALVDVADGVEEPSGTSRRNEREAELAVRIAAHVWRSGQALEKDIGVITFYAAQAALLQQKLKAAGLAGVKAATGFQGSENRVIILSCVRADGTGVGFLRDARRLNVALTRAQATLVVLANVAALMRGVRDSGHHGEHVSHMVEDLRARHLHVSSHDVWAQLGMT